MKRKLLCGLAVLAIAVAAAWNVNLNSQTKGMSDVMLANVEALADSEEPGEGGKNCKQKTKSVDWDLPCDNIYIQSRHGLKYSCEKGESVGCKEGFIGVAKECDGSSTTTTADDPTDAC